MDQADWNPLSYLNDNKQESQQAEARIKPLRAVSTTTKSPESIIASVPYDIQKSYDFYANKVVIGSKTIPYEHIQGYGYLLTHFKRSINGIPTNNSTYFNVYLDLGDGKPFVFGRRANSPLLIKSDKQRTIDLIFAETVKCLEVLVAPRVFEKCMNNIKNGGLAVGKLTISSAGLSKKTLFGKKVLPANEYGSALAQRGRVVVRQKNGKLFYGCPLSTVNAPLLQPILDYLFLPGEVEG